MKPCVWGVIATYHRPQLLQRTIAALQDQGPALAGVILIDNGGMGELPTGPVPIRLIRPPENLGTAGGLAAGLQAGLTDLAITHFWILDDDAVPEAGALTAMLQAGEQTDAAAVTCLLSDATGRVAWFPGPLKQPAWNVIRSGVTPVEFCERCGTAPLRWNWATWASMLIARPAIETVGLPNAKLWYQGTDIEYSLRLSARFTCVLAPAAGCRHLPPAISPDLQSSKELWSLQNMVYVAVRLTHGHRLLRHLPGNLFRYWQRRGYRWRALRESIGAFWRGAVLGHPAGKQHVLLGD
jgi:GT2 family glycosyltransferase